MNLTREHAKKWKNAEIMFHPIGIIHSEHTEHDNTPIQGIFYPSVGYIELFEENVAGLSDIESFSHIYALYYFDRASAKNLVQKPFLDGEKERGIFAIRHFNRPNPIGLSIMELLEVDGNILKVSGVDVLDGTPLLDIKPYIRQFDHREEVKSGWVDAKHTDDIAEWNCTPKELRSRERTQT
jgi:tRNA-Thr(GGU) m(6)t(6)A37 methyltransferase TsaA